MNDSPCRPRSRLRIWPREACSLPTIRHSRYILPAYRSSFATCSSSGYHKHIGMSCMFRSHPRQHENTVARVFVLLLLMFVGVFFPFILDIKFVGRTSRGYTGGRSHRTFHPPSFFCGAFFNFSRGKDLAIPFLRRP